MGGRRPPCCSSINVGGKPRYYQSSSCGVRSAVSGCYHLSHKWEFPTSYLTSGEGAAANEIVLSLPYNATDYESAVLPRSVYVQYDALRLEVK